MAILLFTFWASEKLPSTLFFFPNSVDSPEEFLFMISVKFYRAHLHHFLSALALIAKLLIYLKWKKESRRKEKQASVGVGQCFPNVLSPCVRVRLVHWHIPQTCSNLWGRAVGVHSPSRGNTRGTRENTTHPSNYPIGDTSPAILFPRISACCSFYSTFWKLRMSWKAAPWCWTPDILEELWRLCRGCNYKNHNRRCPACLAALLLRLGNVGLSKPEKWFKLRGCAFKPQWLFLQNAAAWAQIF